MKKLTKDFFFFSCLLLLAASFPVIRLLMLRWCVFVCEMKLRRKMLLINCLQRQYISISLKWGWQLVGLYIIATLISTPFHCSVEVSLLCKQALVFSSSSEYAWSFFSVSFFWLRTKPSDCINGQWHHCQKQRNNNIFLLSTLFLLHLGDDGDITQGKNLYREFESAEMMIFLSFLSSFFFPLLVTHFPCTQVHSCWLYNQYLCADW